MLYGGEGISRATQSRLEPSGEIKVRRRILLSMVAGRESAHAGLRASTENLRLICAVLLTTLLLPASRVDGQASSASAPQAAPGAAQSIAISLEEAIHRAQANEPAFASAVANNKVARLDRSIARSALLPNAIYHNQALYTEPNGLENQAGQGAGAQPSPKFIANNAVHEYASQGVFNEQAGLAQVAAVRRSDAAAAMAAAELEIARRGLVAAVSSLYFGLAAADNKLRVAQSAFDEANDFTKLTGDRERAREAAHADTVKAQLQQQQRERELSDARLAAGRARLELAVLLFADPHKPYTIGAPETAPLPARADVEQAAANNNAELKSALATVSVSNADVLSARAAYLPGLGLNFTYGIDAPQFAVNGPDGVRNLGYSASVTLDIPVWDWLSTEHKVKQSEIRRDAAKVALSATQRLLIARLDEAYAEAAGARDQLASLDASVATAAESLHLTKLRYTAGEATVLEVVDAQSAFVSAENAREDGRVRYRAALADLQTLTGPM
jgi:outer membrane protein TolC